MVMTGVADTARVRNQEERLSEPAVQRYHRRTIANKFATILAATRPAFLTASILPVLAGGALTAWSGQASIAVPALMLAVVNIALIHAGANVLNDYFDAVSGNDRANAGYVHPFSGGSRFIPNDVLSERETLRIGMALMLAGAVMGLGFVWVSGPALLAIGVIGTVLAITYSSPPCLACRGLGDLAIGIAFGVLPVAGTTIILTGSIPTTAWWLGAIIACFVAAILWVNSIPDIPADRFAGKWTLPARLGATRAGWLLPVWFAAGFAILLVSALPRPTWIALGAAIPAAIASRAAIAGRLLTAMPMTILTHAMATLLLVAGLLYAR